MRRAEETDKGSDGTLAHHRSRLVRVAGSNVRESPGRLELQFRAGIGNQAQWFNTSNQFPNLRPSEKTIECPHKPVIVVEKLSKVGKDSGLDDVVDGWMALARQKFPARLRALEVERAVRAADPGDHLLHRHLRRLCNNDTRRETSLQRQLGLDQAAESPVLDKIKSVRADNVQVTRMLRIKSVWSHKRSLFINGQ